MYGISKEERIIKLHLGCGSLVPEGWINVDYALGARLAKVFFFGILNRKLKLFDLDWNEEIYIHDLTKKLPWADNSVDIVYSSHTLEHFSREEGRSFLYECHRVLRKNGIIRIVVPDLRHVVTGYIEGRIRADNFLEKLGVLYGNSKSSFKNRLSPLIHFPHKCMYDTPRLLEVLSDVGFEAKSREPFDSDISDVRLVELEGRTENAVIVEGRKV